MFSNTKLLVFASLILIIFGFSFLFIGLKPDVSVSSPTSIATPIPENTPESTKSAVQSTQGEKAIVVQVVDGDTIKVSMQGKEETIRFVGMDTPETVDPRRPVGCFGKEASNETKRLLTNKEVILQKDVSDADKYKRLLRYIYLPLEDGQILFVNDYLVREGFAKVYTYPPDTKFDAQFKQAEIQAKQFKKGLWGKC